MEKIKITLDKTKEEVLELDEKGAELYFDDESFLDLGDDAKNLSHDNRIRYSVAKEAHLDAEKQKDVVPSEISITSRMVTATNRLDVKGADPKMHLCWKRTDELQLCYQQGYTHCREGKDGISFGGEKGRIIVLGAAGHEELYLMQIPKEKAEEMERAVSEQSKFLDGAVETTAEANLEQAGGVPFKDFKGKDPNVNFTKIPDPT
jgi:hypothetical protein